MSDLPNLDAARADEMPVLTLRERTPAEREAWWQGARHMHASLLGRLPAAAAVPQTGDIPAATVAAVFRDVGAMFVAVRDTHAHLVPGECEARIEAARQHVYRLADGSEEFWMSIPPRAEKDSDFVLLAPCDIAEAALAALAAVRLELEATKAVLGVTRGERDRARERIAYLECGLRAMAATIDPLNGCVPECSSWSEDYRINDCDCGYCDAGEDGCATFASAVLSGEANLNGALRQIEAADRAAKEGA